LSRAAQGKEKLLADVWCGKRTDDVLYGVSALRLRQSRLGVKKLKRRADLIPNLIETVKGYAKHESSVLEAVIHARNKYATANSVEEKIDSANEISGALNKLFALGEAYPDLKANQNFLELQTALKDTEDKIAYARQFYNDDVKQYKNKIEMFPSNIVAGIGGFKPMPYYEISDADRENVSVSF
jgi:LemA protein